MTAAPANATEARKMGCALAGGGDGHQGDEASVDGGLAIR